MNNRKRAEVLVARLNRMTIGTDKVEWNTPKAYAIGSHKPGARRVYELIRHAETGSGETLIFNGTIAEVAIYLDGVLAGIDLNANGR